MFFLRIYHHWTFYLPSESTYHTFLYLYFSTPNTIKLQIIPFPCIPQDYFLSDKISPYFDFFFNLLTIQYSLPFSRLSVLFSIRCISSTKWSSNLSASSLVCVFCISPQSYLSYVFIVSHPRVIPTTNYFTHLKVFLSKTFSPSMIFPFCSEFNLLSKFQYYSVPKSSFNIFPSFRLFYFLYFYIFWEVPNILSDDYCRWQIFSLLRFFSYEQFSVA